MLGIIIFDNLNDVIYMQCDEDFETHLTTLAVKGGLMTEDVGKHENEKKSTFGGVDRNVVLQLFSPIVTSQRVMQDQFKNGYNFVTCNDGTSMVFHEFGQFMLMTIGKAAEPLLQRYVRIAARLIQLTVGPCVSMLKISYEKTRQLDSLLSAWYTLQEEEQCYLVEAIERIVAEPDVISTCLEALKDAAESLADCSGFIPGHALLFTRNKLLALFSREEAEQLTGSDILLLNLVVESCSHRDNTKPGLLFSPSLYPSTDNPKSRSAKEFNSYELFLETSKGKATPHVMFFHQVTSELNLVLLVEVAWSSFSGSLTSLLGMLEKASEDKRISIEKMEEHLRSTEDTFNKLPKNIWEKVQGHMIQTDRRWESMKNSGVRNSAEIVSKSESTFGSVAESVRAAWQAAFIQYQQPDWHAHITAAIRTFHVKICGNPTLLQPKALLSLSSGQSPLLTINKYMEEFPGLVHFIYIDRFSGQLTAPVLETRQCEAETGVTGASLWAMGQFAREHLTSGHQCLLWKDRTFTYSYFLWFEDLSGNPMKPEEDIEKLSMADFPLPGVLAGDFYKPFVSAAFPSMDPSRVRVYELFCLHLGLATSPCVLEQTRRLAATVWEIAGSSVPNPLELL